MPEISVPARPRVILLVADPGHVRFAPTESAGGGLYPCVVDADNLRTASILANRLEDDAAGNTPLPLLRIRAVGRPGIASDAIDFPSTPRLLAGLIADAIRAGVAAGAVVITTEESLDPQQLREAVAAHLGLTGFDVVSAIPGWHHDTACLAPSY